MSPEEVVIGNCYKVSLPTAKGDFIVREIKQNKKEKWEARCIPVEDEGRRWPQVRTFYVSDLNAPSTKKKGKSVAQKVVADLLDEIPGNWPKGVKVFNVKVHSWPDYKRRGRKPSNGQ